MFNVKTSTKIVHSCVRPYKTIHIQTRPFETLQGNTFALDNTKPNKTTQNHTYHKRPYQTFHDHTIPFKTKQTFKRPNNSIPYESIPDQTQDQPKPYNEPKDFLLGIEGRLQEVFRVKLGIVPFKEGHCHGEMAIQVIQFVVVLL